MLIDNEIGIFCIWIKSLFIHFSFLFGFIKLLWLKQTEVLKLKVKWSKIVTEFKVVLNSYQYQFIYLSLNTLINLSIDTFNDYCACFFQDRLFTIALYILISVYTWSSWNLNVNWTWKLTWNILFWKSSIWSYMF